MFIMGTLLTLIKLNYSGKVWSNCHILNMIVRIINSLPSQAASDIEITKKINSTSKNSI